MADLVATAAASTRPIECAPSRSVATIWSRAQTPAIDAYCRHLSFADARMDRHPERALTEARSAAMLLPGRAAPLVASGRALLRLGRLDESIAAFAEAIRRDRRSVDAPLAARDYASAHRRARRLDVALGAYRQLVPLKALLPHRIDEVLVSLAAAHTAMAHESSSATPRLEEALGYAREAARLAQGDLRLDAGLTLALLLERSGQRAAADAILAETGGLGAWKSNLIPDYLADPTDAEALTALALERAAPREARQAWDRNRARLPDMHPWARSARERAERLEGFGSGRAKPRRK